MAIPFQLTIDCADPDAQVRFWAGALDDDAELGRHAVLMRDPEGNEFRVA